MKTYKLYFTKKIGTRTFEYSRKANTGHEINTLVEEAEKMGRTLIAIWDYEEGKWMEI